MDRDISVVVYPQSYVTVRHFVDYLCNIILRSTGRPALLRVAATMEEANPKAESIVLLIGYKFPDFNRIDNCYTAFLNFSVMYPLRSVFHCSWDAIRMMRAKRKSFLNKLPGLDAVLDFHPHHAKLLARKLAPIPVSTFPVNVMVTPDVRYRSIADCEYDVCVVGQRTRRRRHVYQRLERSGLKLSPLGTDDFPGTVERSRFVLNVRSHRYDNLELPRIVTALAMGRCVLSEHTVGLSGLFPHDVCLAASYREIAQRASELAADLKKLSSAGAKAGEFMREQYDPACDERWEALFCDLQLAADRKLKRGRISCCVDGA